MSISSKLNLSNEYEAKNLSSHSKCLKNKYTQCECGVYVCVCRLFAIDKDTFICGLKYITLFSLLLSKTKDICDY